MKNRVIFLFIRESKKFYIGSSVSRVAEESGYHKMTLTRAAKIAEKSENKLYENFHYMLGVTDNFIKGHSHGGSFSY